MGSFTLRIDTTEAQKYRANYWDFTLTGELVDNAHQIQKAKINARLTIDRDDPTPKYLVSWVTVSRDKNREVQTVPGLLAESQTALGNLLEIRVCSALGVMITPHYFINPNMVDTKFSEYLEALLEATDEELDAVVQFKEKSDVMSLFAEVTEEMGIIANEWKHRFSQFAHKIANQDGEEK